MEAPKTLQEAIIYFADFENCKSFVVNHLRWTDGVVKCPRCNSEKVFWIEKERVWKCYGKHDHAKFSMKTGTIMEDSANQHRQVAGRAVADRELQERNQFVRNG